MIQSRGAKCRGKRDGKMTDKKYKMIRRKKKINCSPESTKRRWDRE